MHGRGLILAAAVGDCVHVAGVLSFLSIAEEEGYETVFLGPAVSPDDLVRSIEEHRPDIVGLSYRLTPSTAVGILKHLRESLREKGLLDRRYLFGGTAPVCRMVWPLNWFEACFDGHSGRREIVSCLRGQNYDRPSPESFPQTLTERVAWRHPRPIIRHHFGLPDFTATLRGVRELAESEALDVISLGIDQNTQQSFFRPSETDPSRDGAGGVPVRNAEQFSRLKAASRTGNRPLMRCYSGTRDVIKLAGVLRETIDNAWCAVPLYWYNVLDGRGPRDLSRSIAEGQGLMRWHAKRDVPVEVNEAHHWGLRGAHDALVVAAGYLAAYNARAAGVKTYVAQFMFNTPPQIAPMMDLAKMLAMLDLIRTLEDDGFTVLRETRAGLASFPADPARARGHLAASAYLQMALQPHILHVVAYCEADHAAAPAEIVESCRIVEGVVDQWAAGGFPDLAASPRVEARRRELAGEALEIIEAIRTLGFETIHSGAAAGSDPLTNPEVLALAVKTGLFDAPGLRGSPVARGKLKTALIGGACRAVDGWGRAIDERTRVSRVWETCLAGGH